MDKMTNVRQEIGLDDRVYIDYAGIWREMKKKVHDNYRRYGIHPLCKSCKTKSCKVPNVPGLNLICPRTSEYKEHEARLR
jgi:hypothetical protein